MMEGRKLSHEIRDVRRLYSWLRRKEQGEFRRLNRTPFSLGTSDEKEEPHSLTEQDNPSEPLNNY
jgi:hypothetical protein